MRVVVTGASGNVGTALLRRMAATGEHQVLGVSRRRPELAPPYDTAEWLELDLADGRSVGSRLAEAMRGADAVVHLAWLIQPSRDRQLMRRTNVEGTRAVADAARAAGVGQLVHLSSIGAYSAAPGRRVDESWPVLGIRTSGYSVDKVTCEQLLNGYEDDLVVTRLRPTLILQPAAASEISHYFIGPLVPVSALRDPVTRLLPWPRELAVQFVHADDVAAAIMTVLAARAAGAFNVAAEPAVDRPVLRELVGGVGPALPPQLLRGLADLTWRLRLQPTDPGWVDLAVQLPTIHSGRLRALGWQPAHTSTEVLAEFLAALPRRTGGEGPLLYRRTAGALLGRLHAGADKHG